ncbi:hypothetical protein [Paractinoplanes hotanensis]|uniref:Uncharacterized protein n=1 Tax=Paractinoplanes hotanensis TaxID=2906497 RepID=A0ABT0YAL6_9ACTN|nr:hypothetical protein [Actinoplanes hotanensis]MCM4083081.1 hypothetical protein [Actinoplanes hotanensis]
MTDDRRGLRRLQAVHWLLIGLVVVLVAAGIAVVVTRDDADPVVADPTGAPVASASVAPRLDCAPQITATWADAGKAKYGFVYRSRCDQVVRELRFRVTVLDSAGAQAPDGEETAYGGVLFPGGELAAAGGLHVSKDQKIGSLRVQVTSFEADPSGAFSAWAQTQVTDLTRGAPDSFGRFDVGGTVVAQPPSAQVCVAEFVLVMRGENGEIVYADVDPTTGQTLLKPEFSVGALPSLDFARTKIYAPQTPRTERPPRAGMPCNGS